MFLHSIISQLENVDNITFSCRSRRLGLGKNLRDLFFDQFTGPQFTTYAEKELEVK